MPIIEPIIQDVKYLVFKRFKYWGDWNKKTKSKKNAAALGESEFMEFSNHKNDQEMGKQGMSKNKKSELSEEE